MSRLFILYAFLLGAPGTTALAAPVSFETVYASGQLAPAPDRGGEDLFFSNFGVPQINNSGQVAVNAGVRRQGSFPFFSVFMDDVMVARDGDDAPGTDTGDGPAQFSGFSPVGLNADGTLAFTAGLTGGGSTEDTDSGLFTTADGLVFREGDDAPGTGDGGGPLPFANFIVDATSAGPAINDNGELGFTTFVDTGEPVDDGGFGFGQAGGAGLGGPVSAQTITELAVFGPGGKIFQVGDPAPGTDTGSGPATFSSFVTLALFPAPVITSSGDVVFGAFLENTDGNDFDNFALYVSGQLFARGGDMPASTDRGDGPSTIIGLGLFDANDAGQIAWNAALLDPGGDVGTAIFIDDQMIVRTGDPAPGTDIGFGLASFENVLTPKINELGQIVFSATLMMEAGVNEANDSGLWLWDPMGGLVKLLRDGDPFDLGEGDVRILSSEFGVPVTTGGLNDQGEAVLRLSFSDRSSAIVIANTNGVSAVPLPPAAPLLVLGLGGLALLRRRARKAAGQRG